jgi:capsular exopolysaccharide synthesis family protein
MLRESIAVDKVFLDNLQSNILALRAEITSPLRSDLYQTAAIHKVEFKRQILGTIGAALLALFLVCLGVAWWEFKGRRIYSSQELTHGVGIRVVGAVPVLPAKTRQAIAGPEQQAKGQDLIESIDGIRAMLLRDASVEATRVVMVTSAVAGEGKTTLASHLAGSLARAGRRTLLVDCDLRGPAAHQLFELPLQPGFSEVLLEEIDLASSIIETSVPGLSLLAAGQWDREVMDALARDGVAELFERLKEEFDFIVVDSHPVLPAADSLLLGQHADAVILSVLRDVSQAPRVYAACQRLSTLGIRILGAVVNGTDPSDLYVPSGSPALAAAAR